MKLAVVTVHLNDILGLKRTFGSLAGPLQAKQLSWLVIDGGSHVRPSDAGLLEQVKGMATCFVSEPDDGIYDAMNKGTGLVSGDYVLYLNAGDELHPSFDPDKFMAVAEVSGPDMLWGRCFERYGNGQLVPLKTRAPSWAWYGMPVYHAAVIFKRSVLGATPYDTRFAIAADFDLLCRLLANGATVASVDCPVSIFHRGGVSTARIGASLEEENEIRLKHFRVPAVAGSVLKYCKNLNARLARLAWIRRRWRGRV
jgi:putative colanic acid biosynthesis glycosyltransferase